MQSYLSFSSQDKLIFIKKDDVNPDYYLMQTTGPTINTGLVHKTYLIEPFEISKPLSKPPPPTMAPPPLPPKPPKPTQLQALFDYTAQNDDELTFKEGEIFNFINPDPINSEWRYVQNSQGKRGLIPGNYVTELLPSGGSRRSKSKKHQLKKNQSKKNQSKKNNRSRKNKKTSKRK